MVVSHLDLEDISKALSKGEGGAGGGVKEHNGTKPGGRCSKLRPGQVSGREKQRLPSSAHNTQRRFTRQGQGMERDTSIHLKNKHRMKHALWSLIKTPQNNLKICKNGKEVYGSEIRQNLSAILSTWFPSNPNRTKKLISVFLDLVIEVLLTRPSTDQNSDPCPAKPGTPVRSFCSQKCDSSSFVYCEDEKSEELPQGCVLEKIYSLQSLDDLDIEGVYPLYKQLKTRMEKEPWLINHWCLNGPYDDVSWLLGRDGEHLSDLDPDSLDYAVLKVKRFLVSKTLQDCSIIAAIQPVTKSIQHKQDFLRFDGDLYNFSVKVIDLDPKPFEKVETYYRQASDIAKTFAETSSAFTKDCDSF
ncbi:inositol-pentakisphosphate 2-kinase-like isoform X2 [Biomphalaria glabrata]|nr:inositol-pentakisphosphate 2-kinase-like isoform X2 [Biomphalaria glabrata]